MLKTPWPAPTPPFRDARHAMNPQSEVRTGDPSALRRLNLKSVLRVLHAGGVHTITELARQAQLSRPTTTQAVDDLLASGWVAPATQKHDGAVIGRPAKAFEFKPDAGYVLGADLGASKAMVLITDLDGTIVARARKDLSPELGPEARWVRWQPPSMLHWRSFPAPPS